MQFLAHLPLDTGVVSVFFCQNDPGMCDDWDATAGGNRAYPFQGGLAPAVVPGGSNTLLEVVTALTVHPGDVPTDAPVLGRWGGVPDWIQADETPRCLSCAVEMAFVAELEEGYDVAASANFGGGGRGYVFACRPCAEAAFLWQR